MVSTTERRSQARSSSCDRATTTPEPRWPSFGFRTTGSDSRSRRMKARTCASFSRPGRKPAISSLRAMRSRDFDSPSRIANFDSPMNPPAGIAGLAAVNAIRLRCLIARAPIQNTRGMYDSQGGQYSHRVRRIQDDTSRRHVRWSSTPIGCWTSCEVSQRAPVTRRCRQSSNRHKNAEMASAWRA